MRSPKSIVAFLIAILSVSFVAVNARASGDDRSLEQRIYKRLLGLTEYGVFDHITFTLEGSTVVLEGKVASNGTRNDAVRELKNLPGVTSVVNNIEQLPNSPFDDQIRERALIAFANSGAAQYFATPRPEVRIIVENGRLTLEGYVNNKSHSDVLNILAHGIQGVFTVQNNLIVGRDVNR
jgi:osmotically-inducible protein OsmY